MIRTFIQVLSLLLAFVSAVFLVKSIVGMSVQDMAEQSKSGYGYTLHIAENLARQKADTVIGISFLMFSIIFGLINMLWPMRACDFVVNKRGVLAAIAICIILFFVAYKIADGLRAKWSRQAKDILTNTSDS